MKAYIILLLCGLSALGLQAQNLQFRVGGGLASHYGKAQNVGAFKVGLGYEFEFDQHWTLTPSLAVYGKGWKDPNQLVYVFDDAGNQLFDEETGEPLQGVRSRSASQNYVQLPVLLSYYWRMGESRYVVMAVGPYVAYGVSGKQKTKGDTEQPGAQKLYYERKTFSEPGTHRFDAGIEAFAGYQFPSGLTLGLEADFGLAKFNRSGRRNISALLSLGYRL